MLGFQASRKKQSNTVFSGNPKNYLSIMTQKCPICEIFARAIVQWPEGQHSLGLGTWQGFLDRPQCDTCQMIARRMSYKILPDETEFEPISPSEINRLEGCFWIGSVCAHILAAHLKTLSPENDVLHRIAITLGDSARPRRPFSVHGELRRSIRSDNKVSGHSRRTRVPGMDMIQLQTAEIETTRTIPGRVHDRVEYVGA